MLAMNMALPNELDIYLFPELSRSRVRHPESYLDDINKITPTITTTASVDALLSAPASLCCSPVDMTHLDYDFRRMKVPPPPRIRTPPPRKMEHLDKFDAHLLESSPISENEVFCHDEVEDSVFQLYILLAL